MADSENTPTSLETPTTISRDITHLLTEAADVMDGVRAGLLAFLQVAADNGSDFSRTAHWMIGKVHDDFARAQAMVDASHAAARVDTIVAPWDRRQEATDAAIERLKEFAAQHPDVLGGDGQSRIDGAVADAVFVLARALRWGQFEPMVAGLRRAGIAA